MEFKSKNIEEKSSAPKTVHNKIKYFALYISVIFCIIILLFIGPMLIISHQPNCAIAMEGRCITLEKADNESKREQGLSYRNSMPATQGMLFVFDRPEEQCFWMKDMKYSLDLIWLDQNKRIIDVKEHVAPETYPQSFCVGNSKYVIELNSGVYKKTHLSIGQKLEL